MNLPASPAEIPTMPAKFSSWQMHQETIFKWLVKHIDGDQDHSVFLVDAPTGVGKTASAIGTAKFLKEKTLYVVGTKQLQEQVEHDFPDVAVIKGRENYKCLRREDRTARDCIHDWEHPCPFHDKCPYRLAKEKALASQLAVVNYAYFMTEANYVGGFSGWPLVVLDEADTIEKQLLTFVTLEISEVELTTCGIMAPAKQDTVEDWKTWAKFAEKAVMKRVSVLDMDQASLTDEPKKQRQVLDEMMRYKRLAKKLASFQDHVTSEWIFSIDFNHRGLKYVWKPIRVNNYGSELIFDHGEVFVAMSATLQTNGLWESYLGLPQAPFCSVDSPFPPSNRWVFALNNIGKLDKPNLTANLGNVIQRIDYILGLNPEKKGLIHSQTYELAEWIVKSTQYSGRIFTHDKNADKDEVLKDFADMKEPRVLASPAMTRGVDLPGKRAEFQIVVKVPWSDLSDAQVSRRSKLDPVWYRDEATRSLVQMCGRIVRSQADKKHTYLLDSRFPSFCKQSFDMGLLRPWFMKAFVVSKG